MILMRGYRNNAFDIALEEEEDTMIQYHDHDNDVKNLWRSVLRIVTLIWRAAGQYWAHSQMTPLNRVLLQILMTMKGSPTLEKY